MRERVGPPDSRPSARRGGAADRLVQGVHRTEPDVGDLVAHHGASMTVTDWAARLACSSCGTRWFRRDGLPPQAEHSQRLFPVLPRW
jgi:hypothetical protein